MIFFIILIGLGVFGTIGTLWFSAGSLRYRENIIAKGDEWFSISPEVLESRLGMKIRETFRSVMKVILIWLIKQYRETSQKINLKQTVKKKVRAFLYDHNPEGQRNPSEFWSHVKHPVKAVKSVRSRAKKIAQTPVVALEETPLIIETVITEITEEPGIEENV